MPQSNCCHKFYLKKVDLEQKRRTNQSNFISNLKKGDRVVTAGGLHGKIMLIDEKSVTLEVDRGTKLKFDKNSISFEMSGSK